MRSERFSKALDILIPAVAIIAGLYHIVVAVYYLQTPIEHTDTHYAFALLIIFLATMRKRTKWWPVMVLLLVLALVSTIYVKIFYTELTERAGSPTVLDVIIGLVLVFLSIEACREAFGWVMPITALVFIIYTFLGQYLPEPLYHQPIEVDRVVSFLSIGLTTGLFGTTLSMSANYIFLFILFGALFQVTGAVGFFTELGKIIGRLSRAGPAMASVVTSCVFGTISGSSTANITLTGSFTIPLMKKVGYKPEQAAAIEAVASTGGLIMPPVMGAVAFVMAGMLGIPYIQVIRMAVIPALLYYFACGVYVQLRAMNLKIQCKPEKIDTRELMLRAPLFLVPLLVLVILMVMQRSPMYSVFWALISVMVLSYVRKETRPSLGKLVNGFTSGAKTGASIAVACALAGPLLSSLTVTGLGFRLPSLIESWSGGNIVIALVLTTVITIILGMGLPSVAAYLIVAMMTAPALLHMGVPLNIAHFFVLFNSVSSGITLPIAVAALTAAALAGADYVKTGVESLKLSYPIYLLPFIMVWFPMLLLIPSEQPIIIQAISFIAILLGIIASGICAVGQYFTSLNLAERFLSAIALCGLFGYIFTKSYEVLAVGIIVLVLLTIWQWRKAKEYNSQIHTVKV